MAREVMVFLLSLLFTIPQSDWHPPDIYNEKVFGCDTEAEAIEFFTKGVRGSCGYMLQAKFMYLHPVNDLVVDGLIVHLHKIYVMNYDRQIQITATFTKLWKV